MTKRPVYGALALLGLLVLATAVTLLRDRPADRRNPTVAPEGAIAAGSEATRSQAPATDAEHASGGPLHEAVAVANSGRVEAAPTDTILGLVVDLEGKPVPGASVSLSPLAAFLAPGLGWNQQDWNGIAAATATATTGRDGAFTLPRLASKDGGTSVLWVTGLEHGSAWTQLGADPQAWELPAQIELAPAAACTVSVVDSSGAPVPDALVEVFPAVPPGAAADAFDPQSARVLWRSATTGTDGFAAIAPLSGEVALRASQGELTSEVWLGPAKGIISLTLRATCTIAGRVIVPADVVPEEPPHVSCLLQRGGQAGLLATNPVDPGGAWGPVDLPADGLTTFRVRLEGGGLEVQERVVALGPGQAASVDFHAGYGTDIWFLVNDQETDQPLLDSQVAVEWDSIGVQTRALGQSREDGYVLVRGCPAGALTAEATSPGYAASRIGPIIGFEAAQVSNILWLTPAAGVRGRVVHAGEPVQDFEVIWWPAADYPDQHTAAFRAMKNGEFALEDVPSGDIMLTAIAAGLAPGDPVRVSTGVETGLVIELPGCSFGRGRVVDRLTGDPVPGAVVQPFIMSPNRNRPVAPCGAPVPAQADGSFEAVAFAAGVSRLLVSAPGYSVAWLEAKAGEGEAVDFGLVALGSRQTLTVRLVSDLEFDATRFRLWAWGDESLPERAFGVDATLRIPDVSAGVYDLSVSSEQGFRQDKTVVLEPGGEWVVDLPVQGSHTLTVEVVAGPGSELPPGMSVELFLASQDGRPAYRSKALPADGKVSFQVLPGDFSVRTTSGARLYSTGSGTVGPQDPEVFVRLEPTTNALTVHVVDAHGDPLEGAWVGLTRAGDTTSGGAVLTGPDGVGRILGLEPGLYYAAAEHVATGARYAIPVEVAGLADEALKIVLDGRLHVEVQLLDGTEELMGVPCRLWDAKEINAVPSVTTNETGLARWDKLGEGSYVIAVGGPSVWDTRATVQARADDLPTAIQVRRLGDLEFRVLTAGGLPLPGATLAVESADLHESVQSWVNASLVRASSMTLTTDGQGTLLLEGLPHGKYTWTAIAAPGVEVQGVAQVRRDQVNRVVVTAP